MAEDDDADCVHVWRLVGVALISGHGAPTEYECVSCGAVLYRAPDDVFPETV
jgi:hypothetical protein